MELISCLCVSKPSRWGQLQRAILDFRRQTYRDRELVIVVDGRTDYHTLISAFIAEHSNGNTIRVHPYFVRGHSDGLLYAQAMADGRILALWDDDNLNHARRLEDQAEKLNAARDGLAVCTSAVYYFHDGDEVFFLRLPQTADGRTTDRVFCSSLMGRRAAFLPAVLGPRTHAGRSILGQAVAAGKRVVTLDGYYHLVGVTHDNLTGPDALRTQAVQYGLTHAQLATEAGLTTEAVDTLNGFHWDKDRPLTVSGRDGSASALFVPSPITNFPIPASALFPVVTKDGNVQVVNERSPH